MRPDGGVRGEGREGLFDYDTRILSHWRLTLERPRARAGLGLHHRERPLGRLPPPAAAGRRRGGAAAAAGRARRRDRAPRGLRHGRAHHGRQPQHGGDRGRARAGARRRLRRRPGALRQARAARADARGVGRGGARAHPRVHRPPPRARAAARPARARRRRRLSARGARGARCAGRAAESAPRIDWSPARKLSRLRRRPPRPSLRARPAAARGLDGRARVRVAGRRRLADAAAARAGAGRPARE